MKKLIPQFGEARLQSRGDAFTTLARSIVGQQISVKAAQSVWDRLVRRCSARRPTRVTPLAVQSRRPATMRGAGLSLRKAEYLLDLARHFDDGRCTSSQWQQMDDESDHRRAGRDPRHRPLDRRDVPDLPPDAARTCCRSTTWA